jgi:LEA14-like dessication related protein
MLAAALAGSGCAQLEKRRNIQNCKFEVQNLEVVDLSFTRLTLRVFLSIENPSADDVIVDRLVFNLSVEGKRVGEGSTAVQQLIPPGGKQVATVDFVTTPAELGLQVVSALGREGRVNYRIDGKAYAPLFFGQEFFYPFSIDSRDQAR